MPPTLANHYNQFIVGTVWNDIDWDGMYDPNEGIGGVTVTPDSGTYYAITSNSGGYAIPVTMAAGNHSGDLLRFRDQRCEKRDDWQC